MASVTHTFRALRRRSACALVLSLLAAAACTDATGTGQLPRDVGDPAITQSRAGALSAYRGTIAIFRTAYSAHAGEGGLLGDELESSRYGTPVLGLVLSPDHRRLPESINESHSLESFRDTYALLQTTRAQARQTYGLLEKYATDASPALRGHVRTFEAYAEIQLADLFCSGIPLSTVDFEGDFTLKPGSPTDAVYEHALALLDSAVALSADSARVLNLARIGRGRALLALGRYAEAAAAVADVPDDFRYLVTFGSQTGSTDNQNFMYRFRIANYISGTFAGGSVADRDGVNGLPFRSAADRRVPIERAGTNANGVAQWRPTTYAPYGSAPMLIASGIEARLIEAEAALAANDPATWLERINLLRRTAITPALADTADPGTPAARIDLLFRERGFWLYLTGHRQGDLRRLARVYGRNPESVYPSGPYGDGQGTYGTDVNYPVPVGERKLNPLYHGCLHRNA